MADGGRVRAPVAIRVSGLGRRFGKSSALQDVSLEVGRGELLGVVGGDGAGKTTLLQSICAILDPTSGTVAVEGHDSVRESDAITSRIGYVAQSYSLYEDLTVQENLEFFGAIRGVAPSELPTRAAELLAFAALEPFLDRRAKNLSGGMQKKLAVCCSLLHRPSVLVLDEPTLGVDPVSRRDLWRMLARFHDAGNTIVLATSYMDEAARCDRVALLQEGKLIACAPPRELGADLEDAVVRLLTGAPAPPSAPRAAAAPVSILPSIEVNGLTKAFGDFVAVDQVDLAIAPGELFGLLGPNGSGKSTTIKMLCGIYPPSAGTVRVAGVDVTAHPGEAKERIGYMSQRFSLYPDLTVAEHIEFFGGVYGLSATEAHARSANLLRRTRLSSLTGRMVRSLSGALRQHVALACALLHRPTVLFLDEPTSGVDPAARRDFWSLIRELCDAGTTVLVTTHYLREAEACDRIALIDHGRIIAINTPRALCAQLGVATLEDAFLAAIESRQ